MVIKTIGSFTSRPLLWFAVLSLPLLAIGLATLGFGVLPGMIAGRGVALPLAGAGVVFIASAFFLIAGGALGELIYKTGDIRDHKFAELTAHTSSSRVS
jgi:hypothetical protein